MKAMVLAAGLGTRLRPLTNDRPKALVEVSGRTLLEITLRRLASFGIREMIINVHHFADEVVDYLKRNNNFGLHIEISREDDLLLDTGGGLKKASWFFLEDADKREPFLLHNVDVISTIDFAEMLAYHQGTHALATLAVQKRHSSRLLLLDEQNQLCGRQTGKNELELACGARRTTAFAFSGIHVISPEFLPLIVEEGTFSIITTYLRIAAEGQKILGFPVDGYYWRDLGKPENLAQVEADVRSGIVSI